MTAKINDSRKYASSKLLQLEITKQYASDWSDLKDTYAVPKSYVQNQVSGLSHTLSAIRLADQKTTSDELSTLLVTATTYTDGINTSLQSLMASSIAKAANDVRSEILGGAGEAYNTLKEIQLILSNSDSNSASGIVQQLASLNSRLTAQIAEVTLTINTVAAGLQKELDIETAARVAGDKQLYDNLASLTVKTEIAVVRIDATTSDLMVRILKEIADRTSAVAALDGLLVQEISERKSVDDKLEGEITSVKSSVSTLTDKVALSAAAITDIGSQLVGLNGYLQKEINDRTAASYDLTVALSAEIASRKAIDVRQDASITKISSDLQAETAQRMVDLDLLHSKDADQDAAIKVETASRIAGESALQTSVSKLDVRLASETEQRLYAINELNVNLGVEKAARMSDIASTQAGIASEVATRISEDQKLAALIVSLQGTLDYARTELSKNKVNVAGDTMTGDLTMAEGAKIISDTYQVSKYWRILATRDGSTLRFEYSPSGGKDDDWRVAVPFIQGDEE